MYEKNNLKIIKDINTKILILVLSDNLPPNTPPINKSGTLTELELKIFNLIKNNQKITREEIAIELNISFYTVKEYINKLKKKDFILRAGTKNGYWLLK